MVVNACYRVALTTATNGMDFVTLFQYKSQMVQNSRESVKLTRKKIRLGDK